MIQWIESQPTAEIAVVVFGFCYGLAAVVFIAATWASSRPFAGALKATSPGMLTPLSLIAGLLIVFLAARVWSNLDRANTYIAQEASTIREAVLLADALPADERTKLQAAIQTYVRFVVTEDFPTMADDHASLRQPPALTDALDTLLAFVPAGAGQQLAQQRAMVAVEQAMEARRNRILLSRTAIEPIQWLVVVVMDALILLTIAMVHVDRRSTVAVNLFISRRRLPPAWCC